MECPLRVIANCSLPSDDDIGLECIQQRCEWWIEFEGEHGVVSKGCAVTYLVELLLKLVKR